MKVTIETTLGLLFTRVSGERMHSGFSQYMLRPDIKGFLSNLSYPNTDEMKRLAKEAGFDAEILRNYGHSVSMRIPSGVPTDQKHEFVRLVKKAMNL